MPSTTGEPPRIYACVDDRRSFLRALATPAGALLPTRAMVAPGTLITAVVSTAGPCSTMELSLEVSGRQLRRRRDRLTFAGLTVRFADLSGPWLECATEVFEQRSLSGAVAPQVTCVIPSVAELHESVLQLVQGGIAAFPVDLSHAVRGAVELCCLVPWPLVSLRFRAEACGYRHRGTDGDLEVRLAPGDQRARLFRFLAGNTGALVHVREAPEASSC
jgi:hypothetical protein